MIPATCTLEMAAALVLSLYSTLPQAAQAATPPGDSCSLFTASQVSDVLGVTVSAGQHPIASSLLLCAWAPTGAPHVDDKQLSVSLMTERAFDVGKAPQEGIRKIPLSGVGDDAYYTTAGGLGTALSVKKGRTCVQIRVGGFPLQKDKELEKVLALQMLANL
jgi:hypothetical protein